MPGRGLLIAAALLVVAAFGAWWLWPGPDSPAELGDAAEAPPPATETPRTSPPPAPDTSSDASSGASPSEASDEASGEEPGPDPREAPPRVAVLTGRPGGVVDPEGNPPADPEPAADLREVCLEDTGEDLVVTFALGGPVPESHRSLLWAVDFLADGELVYTASAQLLGPRLVAGVLDWATAEQEPLPEPRREGATLVLRVPWSLLPRLGEMFDWRAMGQVDMAYEDHLPAEGGSARFPGD